MIGVFQPRSVGETRVISCVTASDVRHGHQGGGDTMQPKVGREDTRRTEEASLEEGNMSTGMVTALAGVLTAVSALIVALLSRRKTAAETAKLVAETDKIRRETAEIDSRAANAESMARFAYQTSPSRQLVTLYDSHSGGFSLFDFETDHWEGAGGELSLASSEGTSDNILVIVRFNTQGTFVAWLNKYGYIDGPTMIPVGDAAGVKRRFRVRCQVRTLGALGY